MGTDPGLGPPRREERPPRRLTSARVTVACLFIGLGVASVIFNAGRISAGWNTGVIYIGIPVGIAVAMAMLARPKNLTGQVMNVITFMLLGAWIFAIEGFLCIVMAAPLFYLAGLLVVGVIRLAQGPRRNLAVIPMLFMTLLTVEGTHPALTPDDTRSVTATRVVDLAPEQVADRLAEAPDSDRALPALLRRFPPLLGIEGEGLAPGDRRVARFGGKGGGVVRLAVDESTAGSVRFAALEDSTAVARWLGWQTSEVRWEPSGDGGTRVSWTISYERRLYPSAYFGPLQSYAVSRAATWLLDAHLR